jgi:hypothetical protein
MLRAATVLCFTLLATSPANASLDAPEPKVMFWSLPFGFVLGLASLLVRPSRRWPFLVLPAVLAALAVTWKIIVHAFGAPTWQHFLVIGMAMGVLSFQVGAGFFLALLASLSAKAIRSAKSSTASNSAQVQGTAAVPPTGDA